MPAAPDSATSWMKSTSGVRKAGPMRALQCDLQDDLEDEAQGALPPLCFTAPHTEPCALAAPLPGHLLHLLKP